MIVKTVLLILALLLSVFSVFAQNTVSQTATVYVYMPEHTTTIGRFSGKVYVDDKPVVEINKKRYFVLHLPAGSHSFYVKNKKFGGLVLDLTPGAAYYLKINLDEGGYFMRFRGLSAVPKEEAEFLIKQLQPIKRKDVYDKALVDLNILTP